MIETSRNALSQWLKTYDVGTMAVCFLLAMFLSVISTTSIDFFEFLGMRVKVQNGLLFLAMLALWSALFEIFGLYRLRLLASEVRDEEIAAIQAVSVGTFVLWFLQLVLKIEAFTPRFLAYFWILASAAAVGGRALLRSLFIRIRRSGLKDVHVVIAGTNKTALEFAQTIQDDVSTGYRLLGFVDDDWYDAVIQDRADFRIVSDFEGFGAFLRRHVVDEVIIFTPVSLYKKASRLLAQCEEQGVRVRFRADLFTPIQGRSFVDQFGERLFTTVENVGVRGGAVLVKRLMDLIVSASSLALLAPLLIGIGILVRATSSGPAFFLQERIGLNKRRFKVIKFRTMALDAEKRLAELERLNEAGGPVFKIRRDPRITRVGAFLRKTSLDELPQLINVLVGEMSLVGPRPLPVRDYEGFSQDWHRRRFSVRPGITCLWQVGGRSALSFEQWMELDMQYIDHWSLVLDIRILLLTVPAVLRGSGAY
jgi:exopolysaccharide biosynthesis polyprenyl glycosylphosphotransferase